jgi:hypothetical protein
MQIGLMTEPYSELRSDALITYVFDAENKFEGVLGDINREMNGRLESLSAGGELTGKPLELVLVHFPQGRFRAQRCAI